MELVCAAWAFCFQRRELDQAWEKAGERLAGPGWGDEQCGQSAPRACDKFELMRPRRPTARGKPFLEWRWQYWAAGVHRLYVAQRGRDRSPIPRGRPPLSGRNCHGMVADMFRVVRILVCAAVAAFAATAAAQSAGSALLAQAVAVTQAAKADYAFDYELSTSKANWRTRFDPETAPHLRLIAPARDELDNDQRRAFDRMAEDFEGVSWCASEGMGRVADVRLLREDETSATYSFQPTRESVRGEQAQRFAQRLRGEVTMLKATPDIARVRLYVPESFSPMPLVRLDSLNIVITCQAAPNGRRYAAETSTHLQGSAFGQAFDERSVQRARNLSAS